MTDFSSYTHKWRAAPVGGHQNESNKVNKRNRQPVSCAPCRNRKLKCDRGHPCDACLKRGDEDSCVYGKTATTTPARRDESKSTVKAAERLRHLEELVKQMIGPDKDVLTPQTPPVEENQQPEGSLNRDDNGISYTGSTHWATILNQIQELRNTLTVASPTDDLEQTLSDPTRMDSLFSAPQPPPINVILQRYLPPREECNRYLSSYFNARYMIIPFIHTHQFRRQYEKFWDNQLDASPVWVSILFSILSIADTVRRAPLSLFRSGNDIQRHRSQYLAASAQCLILGNYSKSQPHIIEALAMYSQCKYATTLDPSQELGMVMSILARHAYAMGYHREPSIFEDKFTPFEAEMRRRSWSLLRQFDLMVSFQLGLPVIIQPDSSDTHAPSHLLDDDFDEDTAVLPPPRPDTEPTQVLYLITKARLMETYGKICSHTLTFPKHPYTSADIMSLDNAINKVIDTIPPVLRARTMSMSYTDPANVTMVRSNLMFLGEKARCVLHRKYMVHPPAQTSSSPGRSPNSNQSQTPLPDLNQSKISRDICIAASTRTINHFLDLHAEFQDGGQLFNDRWMLTSFTINDFLLGLMVLCLAFSVGRKDFITNGGDAERWLESDRDARDQYQLLKRAAPVCAQYGAKAREANVVAQAVERMLEKLKPTSTNSISTGFLPHLPRIVAPSSASRKSTSNTNPSASTSASATDNDADKMPINITPLSIHGRTTSSNAADQIFNQPNLPPYSTPMDLNDINPITQLPQHLTFTPSPASNSNTSYTASRGSISGSTGTGPGSSSGIFTPFDPTTTTTSSSSSTINNSNHHPTTDTTSPSMMSWDMINEHSVGVGVGVGVDGLHPHHPHHNHPDQAIGVAGNNTYSTGQFPNLLEGPEQIDWVMFDNFLGTFGLGGQGGAAGNGAIGPGMGMVGDDGFEVDVDVDVDGNGVI